MTEIWLKQCHICLMDFIPLKDFRFFACGHRWCSSCLKKHKGDPLCGECRQPKGKPHRIFLELEDLVDDQIALVTGGLNAINMECSSSDIEQFNQTIQNLTKKPNTDPAVSNVLREAVKDLRGRYTPLVKQCEEYQILNAVLNEQLKNLQTQNRIFKDMHKWAKLSVETEKEESKKLRLAVERQRAAKEAATTEKQKLESKLEEREREIKLLNTKLKVLSKMLKVKSTHSAEDPDASLQIGPSKTKLDTQPRQLKRRVDNHATRQTPDINSPRPFKKVRFALDITKL